MLTRVLALFFVVGLVAGASWNNNNQGTYRDYANRDGQQYGQQPYDPNRDRSRPYEQNQYNSGYNNQNPDPNYSGNQDPNQYGNRNSNRNYQDSIVYAKNQTSIFCYVNGTRIQYLALQDRSSNYERQRYNTENAELNYCTHVIIGAATILPGSYQIRPDADFTTGASGNTLSFNNLSVLKSRHIKVLVSISGDPRTFSAMANDHTHHGQFVTNVYAFLNKFNLDGVNIDWQWPVGPGVSRSDKENYKKILEALRHGDRTKLITVFMPPEDLHIREFLENFDSDIVDFYILMAFELRGHNYQRIEHHAPIDSYNSAQTVKKAIYTITRMIPQQYLYQFVLAIPFYGKRYQLEIRGNSYREESPMNKPFSRVHSYYQNALIAMYPQVCHETSSTSFTHGYDETNQSPYAVHETVVYVYEDPRSVREKTKLAMQNGFGGVMAYSIDMDDIQGQCKNMRSSSNDRRQSYAGSYSERYPLLQAMYDQVQRGSANAFHSSPLAIAFAVVCALILKVNN